MFYTENFSHSKAKGGTEVATFRIAEALKNKGGFKVYNAYRSKGDGKDKSIYDGVIKLGKSNGRFEDDLRKFIQENSIDCVVNMTRFFRHKHIVNAAKQSGVPVKIFFMQHFAPGSEFKKASYKAGFHLLSLNPLNPLYWLRSSFYPLLKLPRNLRLGKVYKEVYDESDKIILLSEDYGDAYSEIGGFSDKSKFHAIPNIYDSPTHQEQRGTKDKRVLILSRLDEVQKRISIALKIWAEIEKDLDLGDWHLDIVGWGHNADIVKRLIKKLGLRNVTLHGWKDRTPFLERDAILMMTSEYEGLPLSLIEAQAYGVVPIAFDSFSSLKDVVTPFENGVVVEKFGDTEEYAKKLKDLMYDEAYRNELSENARNGSNKFSSEKIAEKWLKILT